MPENLLEGREEREEWGRGDSRVRKRRVAAERTVRKREQEEGKREEMGEGMRVGEKTEQRGGRDSGLD